MQVVVYAPMFEKLKFPNNASTLNGHFIKVASFDIINTPEWIDHYLIDLGDDGEPFSHRFEECEFETTWFLDNSSVVVWIWVLNTAFFVAYLMVRECAQRCGILKS